MAHQCEKVLTCDSIHC